MTPRRAGFGTYREPATLGRSVLFPLVALASVGCAATGRAWVQEPEDAQIDARSLDGVRSAREELGPIHSMGAPASESSEAEPAAHRRLDHVVSLGQSAAESADASAGYPPPPPAGQPIVININNNTQQPYGYYGYGYAGVVGGFAQGRGGTVTTSPATHMGSTPALGHDWAPPPNHGPTFPFHSSPAPPFDRAR